MKTVVSNEKVAALWAAQSQETARNGKGSFFFEGDTIYSYGYHFPIARWVRNSRGMLGVLVTTEHRSNTTSAHVWKTRLNIPKGTYKFHVPHVERSALSATESGYNKAYFEKRVAKLLEQARKARTQLLAVVSEAEETRLHANAYAEFFGEPWRLPEIYLPDKLAAKVFALRYKDSGNN